MRLNIFLLLFSLTALAAYQPTTTVDSVLSTVNVNVVSGVSVSGTSTVSGTVSQNGQWNINNISGTVSLPTGAATATKQDTQTTWLTAIESNTSGLLTNGQLRASDVGVSAGTVSIVPLTNSSVVKSQLQDNSGNAISTATTSGTATLTGMLSSLPLGKYNSSAITMSNGQVGNLQLNSAGALVVSGAGTQPVSFVSTPSVSTVGTIIVSGTVLPNGVFSVSNTGTQIVSSTGTVIVSGTVLPNGTFTVSPTGTMSVSAGTISVNTHAVTQSGNWSQSILNSLGIASGTLTSITNTVNVSSTGTVPVSSTGTVIVSGTVLPNGVFSVSPTGTQIVSTTGTMIVSGTVLPNGVFTVSAGTVAITAASLPTHAVTQSGNWSQSILNSLGIASGTLTSITNTVNVSSTGTVPVSSTGTVIVSGTVLPNGIFTVSAGTVAITAASTLNVSSTGVVPVSFLSVPSVSSVGTVIVSGTVMPNGTFTVSTTGTIPITGSITATNPSVGSTGASVPSSATYIGGLLNGNLTGVSLTTAGVMVVSSSGLVQVSGTVLPNGIFQVSPTGVASVSGVVSQNGSWTVTANAGTNLNTSLLALESGGNLASIKTNSDNLNVTSGTNTAGGSLIMAAATVGAPTFATGKSYPATMDLLGNLRTVATPSGTYTVSFSSTPSVSSVGTVIVSGTVLPNGTFQVSPTGTVIVSGTVLPNGVFQVSPTGTINVSSTGTVNVSPTGVISTWETPQSGSTNSLTNSDSANVSKVSVKASAGRIYILSGYNGNAASGWIHLFDSATQPAANTAPLITIPVPASAFFTMDFSVFGKLMSSGIYVGFSTSATAWANTTGSSSTWINVQYK